MSSKPSGFAAVESTLGLAFDRRSLTALPTTFRQCVTLGAFNTPTESCVVSHYLIAD